jgi:hypothetical protein
MRELQAGEVTNSVPMVHSALLSDEEREAAERRAAE